MLHLIGERDVGDQEEDCKKIHDYIFIGGDGQEPLTVWRSNVERVMKNIDKIKATAQAILVGVVMLLAKGVYEHFVPPSTTVVVQSSAGGTTTGSTTTTTH
jgi:hypothetical protein